MLLFVITNMILVFFAEEKMGIPNWYVRIKSDEIEKFFFCIKESVLLYSNIVMNELE